MNSKKYVLTALAVSFITGATLISCKKDSSSNPSSPSASDAEVAENNTIAQSSYDDATTVVDQAAITGSADLRTSADQSSLVSSCATVTLDSTANGKILTINFGTSNCICKDGRYRRGKIIATFNGRYRDSGTVISVTFDGYTVNENVIKGTKTVINKGHNAAGHQVYRVEVKGEIVKALNRGTVSWASVREREWVSGENTPSFADDVYSITGEASGTTAAGGTYTIKISKPLVRKMSCQWFESGAFTYALAGAAARTVDFGDTGCDNKATLTVAGVTFPITLP